VTGTGRIRHEGVKVMNSVASILIVYLSAIPISVDPLPDSIFTTFDIPSIAYRILSEGENGMYGLSPLLCLKIDVSFSFSDVLPIILLNGWRAEP
jgi:hypothetical protein